MPAWWKGKAKSKSTSSSSANGINKEKGDIFDRALILGKGKSLDRSPVHAGPGSPCAGPTSLLAHPLPRPSSSPLPRISPEQVAAATSASTSGSSVSSSGSEEAPDLGLYRFPDQSHMARERTRPSSMPHAHTQHRHLSASPRKESHMHMFEPATIGVATTGRKSMEAVLGHRPGLSTSPVHLKACPVWQEDAGTKNSAHPLPLPLPPGNSLRAPLQSQWKKGKLLGRGTFGHVYLGFNSENGQMCAIKEVNVISDDSNSRESLKQLNQEITMLSSLSHPNIVQYYGSDLADDALSVYLEYVSGGSIHKLLQEYGSFKEPVIRNYTAQILSGLSYLHSRNTVHRDIKGANILVDPCGDVKLADFGMAKHISSYTSVRSFKGSPYWMAPEIIMNANGYNLSVDIWSLGCTILEMITSKPPWSQYEGVAAIFKIGNSKEIPDIPEHFSAEGKHFLNLCLQRDPAARPTAAQLLEHPFVRDQVAVNRAIKTNRDNAPSCSSPFQTAMEFSNRSISPLHDRGLRVRTPAVFPSFRTSNDAFDARANFSLPVSPCSSPLRQKQSNRSCLPSPPHPAFSAGAINYSPINSALYPPRSNDPFLDPTHTTRTQFGSPRNL
ncbi:mitogen-activated protein kinase kinase kinase YODA-like protein [Carex littledalei]|uniref:mitogen-activated protein kinase kinase kinase n=1 Tax=Carex littledalei TaxID=544730 RepID=A0A833QW68_9POAL|nr:mitogen-activated protein kinase kinase kinase YODA-like protein [Carex littledalei]